VHRILSHRTPKAAPVSKVPTNTARRPRGKAPDHPLVPSFDKGVTAIEEDRWGDAVKVFSARVIASPSDIFSRANRAVALWETGRWADAASEFENVVADPASKPLPEFHSLGHCYLNLGRHLEAVEAYRQYFLRATRQNQFFPAALVCLALAVQQLRDPWTARALLVHAVQLRPDAELLYAVRSVSRKCRRNSALSSCVCRFTRRASVRVFRASTTALAAA
jgi:tetratricopeptide (TPR) repeat protein